MATDFTLENAQEGGKYIGSGTYGCVFYPHLRCTRPRGLRKKDAIGKVFVHANDFREEMYINKIIDKIDPKNEFTLPNMGACITSPYQAKPSDNIKSCNNITRRQDKQAELYQILYKFGGQDLLKVSFDPKNKLSLDDLFNMFLPILQGVQRIHNHGYSHFDIKPDNMLFQKTENKLVLIDFGLVTPLKETFTSDSLIAASYPYYPPELKLFYAMKTKMPKSRWHSFIEENYTRYSDVYSVLDSFDRASTRILEFIDEASSKGQTAFLRDCQASFPTKLDVFSLGMTMIELYTYMYGRIRDFTYVNGFLHKVVLPMVDMNPYSRYTIEQAIAAFQQYIENFSSVRAHPISLTASMQQKSNKQQKTLQNQNAQQNAQKKYPKY